VARNPSWNTDELVPALDLYFQAGGWIDDTDPRVIELSGVLNALPHIAEDATTFRNPNGVSMKLGNFLRLDPDYAGEGLARGGKQEEPLFEAWKDRREELHELAESIRRGVSRASLPSTVEPDEGRPEGQLVLTEHRRRERNAKVVRERKRQMLATEGRLRCEVCDLNSDSVRQRYGQDCGELFECHHRFPLGSVLDSRKTRQADLAVVCPLCHAAIHHLFPMPTVEELRMRLRV
jgi:5-methylcytosine-specific restriction protein A